jgi:preprotein translocase subunit SecA
MPEEMNRQELETPLRQTQGTLRREELIGATPCFTTAIMLSVIDAQWKDLPQRGSPEGGHRPAGTTDSTTRWSVQEDRSFMFEDMMQRFGEGNGILYLMQILERPPDSGTAPGGIDDPSGQGPEAGVPSLITGGRGGNGRPPRQLATSVDDIEEAFQRRKKRELEQARMAGAGDMQTVQQIVRSGEKIGRNDPCTCGSGKKYKKCCGAGA